MRPLEVVAAETGNQLDDRFNYTARYDLTRSLAALVGHDWLRLTGTDHECQGRLWSSLGAVCVLCRPFSALDPLDEEGAYALSGAYAP